MASRSVVAAPDSSVAPVIGAGVAALLLTTLPPIVADGLKKLSDAVIGRSRDQRGVAERLDRRRSATTAGSAVVAAVSTPISKRARGRRRCRRRRQFDRLRWCRREIEVEFDLVAVVGIDAAEIDGCRRRHAGRLRDGRAGQRRTAPTASFRPNAEPSSATLVTVVVSRRRRNGERVPSLPVP